MVEYSELGESVDAHLPDKAEQQVRAHLEHLEEHHHGEWKLISDLDIVNKKVVGLAGLGRSGRRETSEADAAARTLPAACKTARQQHHLVFSGHTGPLRSLF